MYPAPMLNSTTGHLLRRLQAVVRLILSPDAGYRVFLTGEKVDPTGQWDGRKVHIFYSASIIWGAIAPARFFVGNYVKLYFGFLIGFLLPVVPWLLNKRFPRKWWQQINFPVLLHGAGLPPQVPTNVSRLETKMHAIAVAFATHS